jgi:hypothetical protein
MTNGAVCMGGSPLTIFIFLSWRGTALRASGTNTTPSIIKTLRENTSRQVIRNVPFIRVSR